MNFIDQLDPELRALVAKLPPDRTLDINKIAAARARMKKMMTAALANLPAVEGVNSQDQFVRASQSAPAVRVRVYRPNDRPSKLPALYWIHGGGYVMGDLDQDDRLMKQLAKRIGCVAVSVDYRLAPEHPFPAPVEDCYAGLKWLFAHADELQVEPSRIAIGGASGGGGLAAGLALLARDRGEVQVAFQLLIYPMIDDRNVTPASYAITDPRMWNRESNRLGWKAYLGRDGGGGDVSPYSAAARATDLTNLPPVYIPVGAQDLFVDENIEYAQRLIQAGVPTELHVYPGAFHGFDIFAPSARVSKQFKADRDDALKRAHFTIPQRDRDGDAPPASTPENSIAPTSRGLSHRHFVMTSAVTPYTHRPLRGANALAREALRFFPCAPRHDDQSAGTGCDALNVPRHLAERKAE